VTRDRGLVRGAVVLILAASAPSGFVYADPFPTRDQNPLLMGFGLPRPLPAALPVARAWSLAADLNWGSTALMQADGDEALIVDAETREVRLTVRRALTERFTLQASAPYRYVGAGSLDGFIDDWHDAFGLPEGARPVLPEDRMRIAYERDGAVLLDETGRYEGLGDVSLDLGLQLRRDSSSALSAWVSIELPTGAGSFIGNDGADISVIAAGERRWGERWSVFAQGGVSHLASSEALAERQRNLVWSGLAGVGVRALPSLDLKLQLDAHTAAFENSDLDYLGEALMLTIGGALRFDSGWRLQLAVSEDVAVESASDVVFVIGFAKEGLVTRD
jgi:hypothetical protein